MRAGVITVHMWRTICKSWFLLALVLVLTSGGLFGHYGPPAVVATFLRSVQPAVTTAIVLFLMAFSLDASKRTTALLRPTASIFGCVLNLGLMPLLAWPLAAAQSLRDFEVGLIVTAATPCTLATASVFTRRAGGNDAVSLVTTLITNLACVVITPLWLQAYFGRSGNFDSWDMIQRLLLTVFLPVVVGQLAQWPAAADRFVRVNRGRIGLLAQLMVLLLVCVAATDAGRALSVQAVWPSLSAAVVLLLSCSGLHALGLAVGWWGSRGLRLDRGDMIAVAIAGSQKTLPVGLMLVASPELAGPAAPFVTFPLVVYHAVQLILDGMLAEHWGQPAATRVDGP